MRRSRARRWWRCSAKKVYDEVKSSPRPDLPIIWSEYNATYMNEVDVTDSVFIGSWLANNIRLCDGLTTMMSYWTFSDVFEEQGVVKKPFYGGYGLIAAGGIPKAGFNAFAMLHRLGDQRLSPELKDAPGDQTRRRHIGHRRLELRRSQGRKAIHATSRSVRLEGDRRS